MKKITIVMQSEFGHVIGGAITACISIATTLTNLNFDVKVVYYSDYEQSTSFLFESINIKKIYEGESFDTALNLYLENNSTDLLIFFFAFLLIEANLKQKFNSIPKLLLFRSRPDFYFKVHDINKLKEIYDSQNMYTQILFDSYFYLLPDYIRSKPVVVIPNSVKTIDKNRFNNLNNTRIIYLSRIDCWKGQKFLINAFKKIANKYPSWSIDIYGESQPKELESYLKEYVKKRDLQKKIFFKGIVKNPYEIFDDYAFCVFPSLFEGFPNGLAESLSSGLPAIGLKGATGVNELIIDNVNGLLSKYNEVDFSKKIELLIKNIDLRINQSQNAINSMRRFDDREIQKKWQKCIDSILANKNDTSLLLPPHNNILYKPFSLSKLMQAQHYFHKKLKTYKKPKHKMIEKFFSLKTHENKKIMVVLGFKIVIKNRGVIK